MQRSYAVALMGAIGFLSVAASARAEWVLDAQEGDLCPLTIQATKPHRQKEPRPIPTASVVRWQKITPDNWQYADWYSLTVNGTIPTVRKRLYRQEDGIVYAVPAAKPKVDYGVLNLITSGDIKPAALGFEPFVYFSGNGAMVLKINGRIYIAVHDEAQSGIDNDSPLIERVSVYRLFPDTFAPACRFILNREQ